MDLTGQENFMCGFLFQLIMEEIGKSTFRSTTHKGGHDV